MNTQSSNILSPLSNEALENLTREVKETLAMGYNHVSSKTFSAAELWNIQRQRKNFNPRRRFSY